MEEGTDRLTELEDTVFLLMGEVDKLFEILHRSDLIIDRQDLGYLQNYVNHTRELAALRSLAEQELTI